MANTIYVPVGGLSDEVEKFYASVGGLSKEVIKGYCSVGGLSKQFYGSGGGGGGTTHAIYDNGTWGWVPSGTSMSNYSTDFEQDVYTNKCLWWNGNSTTGYNGYVWEERTESGNSFITKSGVHNDANEMSYWFIPFKYSVSGNFTIRIEAKWREKSTFVPLNTSNYFSFGAYYVPEDWSDDTNISSQLPDSSENYRTFEYAINAGNNPFSYVVLNANNGAPQIRKIELINNDNPKTVFEYDYQKNTEYYVHNFLTLSDVLQLDYEKFVELFRSYSSQYSDMTYLINNWGLIKLAIMNAINTSGYAIRDIIVHITKNPSNSYTRVQVVYGNDTFPRAVKTLNSNDYKYTYRGNVCYYLNISSPTPPQTRKVLTTDVYADHYSVGSIGSTSGVINRIGYYCGIDTNTMTASLANFGLEVI